MGDPPQLNVEIPKLRDLPNKIHKFSENSFVDFLLLTAVDCELLSCFHYLQEPLKYFDDDIGYVYVGKMGDEGEQEKLTIGLMTCNMGSGLGGSAMKVKDAATILKPKGVLCVGFCGGMNAEKAKLGDVVVSAKLGLYGECKRTDGGNELRGSTVSLFKNLNNLLRGAGHGWKPPIKNMGDAEPKVVFGTMLSGPELVNENTRRGELLKSYPEASAIEMEGEGKTSFK